MLRDFYIVICESHDGERYWRGTYEPHAEPNLKLILGTTDLGAGGYGHTDDAIDAFAGKVGIDLNHPETWPPFCEEQSGYRIG